MFKPNVIFAGFNKNYISIDMDKALQILEIAQRRFGIYGFEKTSMQDIADDLKMTKGSIYYYFPCKEDLFKSVIEKEQNDFLLKIRGDYQNASDNSSYLQEYAITRLSYFKSLLNLARIRQESFSDINPVIRQSLIDFREKEMGIIKNILDKGKNEGEFNIADTGSTAELFLDLLRGLRSAVLNNKKTMIIDDKEYAILLKKTIAFTKIFIKGIRTK